MGRKDKKVPSENQEACHKLNFLHQVSKVSIVLKSMVSTFILKAFKNVAFSFNTGFSCSFIHQSRQCGYVQVLRKYDERNCTEISI